MGIADGAPRDGRDPAPPSGRPGGSHASAGGPQPGAHDPQPSAGGPQPSAGGPQPSAHDPQPSSDGPQPGADGSQPSSDGSPQGARGPESIAAPPEPTDTRNDPRAVYALRRDARRREEARWESRHHAVANARLLVFLGGVAVLWFVFGARSLSPLWLLLPVAAYVPLVLLHDFVLDARSRAARAAALYERGLERLEDRWAGAGPDGAGFQDPNHIFAADLDLFGPGSLFQLVCQAGTRAGKETLARWLAAPAPPAVVRGRQSAVRELVPRLDLREEVTLLGMRFQAGLHAAADRDLLAAWLASPPVLASRTARVAAFALAALAVPAVLGWAVWGTGPSPLAAVLFGQVLLRLRLRKELRPVFALAGDAAADLDLLAAALRRLEKEEFAAPRLRELRRALDAGATPPSRRIRELRVLADCLEGRRNALFAPVSFLLLWDVHFAFALEAWRRAHGPAVPRWIAALGEFETLVSFAWHAFERPGDVDPEFVEAAEGPLFDAEGLGHPLLPEATCVRNDLRLDAGRSLLVVSGSNMSGKSTLLRAAGLAVVLAQAGAPVRARRLRLSPLALGASIRIQDSLQEGISRFYAEIRRLRRIVEESETGEPMLFLIDEILGGTNSHDRRIGAEGVLRGLLERRALGMVTTHDLALTEVARALAPRGENVHFEDRLEEGTMLFDYRLRPGVVTRSNALGLMRAVGLPVAEEAPRTRPSGPSAEDESRQPA